MRPRAALAGAAVILAASVASAAPRVLSLDQCADQYLLALSPRAEIVGLSTRARNADSYLR
ncbi:MAG TPA: ABC transporter substrate-binding protein, partial [Caulobacteraceae bacterium]